MAGFGAGATGAGAGVGVRAGAPPAKGLAGFVGARAEGEALGTTGTGETGAEIGGEVTCPISRASPGRITLGSPDL